MLKRVLIFLGIILGLALLSIFYPYLTGEKSINPVEYERESAFVTRVIDGDTLVYEIKNISYTCRLLGIDNKEVAYIRWYHVYGVYGVYVIYAWMV